MAATVVQLYHDAVSIHGLPSRVPGEQSRTRYKQKILLPEHQFTINAESVFGVRWLDVWYGTFETYFFLKNERLLDPLNEVHMCALHYVYMPRINKALDEFSNDWKYHLLSIVGNRSPFSESTTSNIVEIREPWLTLCNLHKVSRDSVFHLQELPTPLLDDVKDGINVYKEAVEEIENTIEDPCCNVT